MNKRLATTTKRGKDTVPLEYIVAARIKQYRDERGLTQARLANAAGVTTETVARLERNLSHNVSSANGNPSLKTLSSLARVLKVETWELLR